MQEFKNYKIVHIVRSIGPTSMPWNDLFYNIKIMHPELQYYPLAINFKFSILSKILKRNCNDKSFKYIESSIFSTFVLFLNFIFNSLFKKQYYIFHIHNPSLAFVSIIFRIFIPRSKLVFNLHNFWPYYKFYQKFLMYFLIIFSEKVISVSRSCQCSIPFFLRSPSINKYKFIYIRNGINTKLSKSYPILGQNINNVAVVVARKVPQKNHKLILQILHNVPEINKLVWFGDGYLHDQIVKDAISLNVINKIEFMGNRNRSEVFKCLSESAIYIAASKWEGIGVANLEASLLGCVPFLSSIPPHNEIAMKLNIDTYSLTDCKEWCKPITDYLKYNSSQRYFFQNEISNRTKKYFDLDDSIHQYLSVYSSIIRR